MDTSVESKVALVTGGSSGIGKGAALALARAGEKVVIGGRRENEGQAVVHAIQKSGLSVQLCEVNATRHMKALIIYDEFDCAVRASRAVQHAGVRANGWACFDIKPWRTDVLKLRLAAEEALNEAIDADLIVFAGVMVEVMPPWLEKWLKRWAVRRKVRDALLLVIQNRATGSLAVNAGPQLTRLAERHGLGLIARSESGVEDPTPSVAGDPCQRGIFTMPAALPATIQGSWRNWGIND